MTDHPETTDLVTYLRDPRHAGHLNTAAADEIERLRAALADIRKAVLTADEFVLADTLWCSGTETVVDRINAVIGEGLEGRPQEFRIGSMVSVLDGEPACVLGVQADPHSDGVVYRVEGCLHWVNAALLQWASR